MANDQQAIVTELLKRRAELSPDKQAVVDELAKRMNIGAEPQKEEDPGFFKGVYESTLGPIVELGKGLTKDPLGTIRQAAGGIQKAALTEPWKYAGRTGEAMVHGDVMGVIRNAPGMVPLVGPMVEQVPEMVESGQPRRAAGNAVGILAMSALPEATVTAKQVGAKLAPSLKASAANNYRSILLPTKKAVPRAEQTAVALAEQKPVALTQGGLLKRAAKEKAQSGPAAGAAYAEKPPVTGADLKTVLDDIEGMRQKNATVAGPNGPVVVNEPLNTALDNFKAKLTEMQDSFGNVPAEVLDDWRDKLFRGQVDASGNLRAVNPISAKSVERGVANSIRKVLDAKYPDAKALNDTYKLWANTYDFLEDARRASIASKRGINVGSSQGFGALVQRLLPRPVREIPSSVAGVFDSVAWNTVNGATKSMIADALSKGNWQRATNLLRVAARGGVVSRSLEPATATQP